MSFFPAKDPVLGDAFSCDAIETAIVPRTVDLGDLTVRRALPSARRRMVGPFIFSIISGRPSSAPAPASTCARTRTSGSPR